MNTAMLQEKTNTSYSIIWHNYILRLLWMRMYISQQYQTIQILKEIYCFEKNYSI